MAFPVELTSVLSGATLGQLSYWRRGESLLVPEVATRPRALYSFRDVVALRTMVKLRSDKSLQAIRSAFRSLRSFDLTEHPSQYQLVSVGNTIVLVRRQESIDLLRHPGNYVMTTMEDIFAELEDMRGWRVSSLVRPRPHLEVRERRAGGWPTAANIRVPFDSIASLMATGEVGPDDVQRYYPSVTPEAARDAADFGSEVEAVRGAA